MMYSLGCRPQSTIWLKKMFCRVSALFMENPQSLYALCLLAALRAKQCAPQKVTLTLVADRLELEQRLADKWDPPALFHRGQAASAFRIQRQKSTQSPKKNCPMDGQAVYSRHNGFYEDLFDRMFRP